MKNLTAVQIIDKLGMQAHPEGGWFAVRKFATTPIVAKEALPKGFTGARETASLIYYMLQKGEISAWHQLRSAEAWLWHCGGSFEMALAGDAKTPNINEIKTQRLGANLDEGDDFQIIAPANVWQTTRLLCGEFGLASCVVSPAFYDDDCCLPEMEQYFK